MGVRVHKTIGYGARGIILPDGFSDRLEEASYTSLQRFATWCRKRKDEIFVYAAVNDQLRRLMLPVTLDGFAQDKDEYGRSMQRAPLSRYVIHETENAYPDAILFIPPGWRVNAWRRYNNDLDWAEETQFHHQRRRWCPLKVGFDPYPKGEPPIVIAALCMWLGFPKNVFPSLREHLYVYWN